MEEKNRKMKAIIPAAGFGKRLRPHTLTVPKVMLNIAGKPIIGHIIDAIEQAGITELHVITGYKNEKVESFVKERYGHLNLTFPFQKERKGLGHAILQGLEDKDEPVLILLGDTVVDMDFKTFINPSKNVLAVVQVENPERFGIAYVKGDKVTKLIEKPKDPVSNLALAGLYFLRNQRHLKEAIEHLIDNDIRTRNEIQLTDALQYMIRNGEEFFVKEIKGWYDCGNKDNILKSQQFLLKDAQTKEKRTNTVIHPPVFIHPEAKVNNAVIGPFVTIDKGAEVNNSIIRNSIIGKYSKITNLVLSDSLIGEDAFVSSRERQANIGDFSELQFN